MGEAKRRAEANGNGAREARRESQPIVLVSTPSAHMTPGYVGSMEKLRDLFREKRWMLGCYRETGDGIVRARNRAVEFFLRHPVKPTHLMFIDDDLEFDPQDVVTMIESGLDVVGGVYPHKRIDWHKVAAAVKAGVPVERLPQIASPLCWNPKATDDEVAEIGRGPERGEARLAAKSFNDGHGHNFLEVRDLPTGFMLIRCEVFEKMCAHYGDKIAFTPSIDHAGRNMATGAEEETGTAKRHLYFHMDRYPDSADGDYMSEDWWFCRQWQDMGGEVFAFVECRLVHYGTHAFSGSVADQFVAEAQGADASKVESKNESNELQHEAQNASQNESNKEDVSVSQPTVE